MAGNKTRDGLKISKVLKVARGLGASVREAGGSHPYILGFSGMRPCPVASSTDARRMIVPWLQEVTGYDAQVVYSSLRRGRI
jgi:hypothetical protein